MKFVHLIIPDLFLPGDLAGVTKDMSLPALQKMFGRGQSELLDTAPLEALLCELFGVACTADAPIAPISASFDGLGDGCWMRADPVNLTLQRDWILLAGVQASSEEASVMCASLNDHFAGQGLEFIAPHPQRWYVRLKGLPRMLTTPLSQVIGQDVRDALPRGEEAPRWHQVFNDIQMLLHAHPLNEAREARGELTINSVWFWGQGGTHVTLKKSHDCASSDDVMTEMFASSAGIPFAAWSEQWPGAESADRQLLVWTGLRSALQRGDLAAWRAALQDFENNYALPLWQALRSGKIASLRIDVPGGEGTRRIVLTRGDARSFWRRARRLSGYSIV